MNQEIFQLLKDLGGGGFARTYMAKVLDKKLCKEWGDVVVIKIPHNKTKEKNLLKEAFKYERLKDLNSRHIVSYLDIELYREQYVLVLVYIDAVSLEEMLDKKKKLSVDESVNIIKQCCEGLAEAEKINILHRDIDPGNILICKNDGKVKITDFGISEILRNPDQEFAITGKYPYMAPETFEGNASFSSDVYALGVTFYQMLTGSLPFWSKNEDDLMKKIFDGKPVEPRELNKDIDDKLNGIILKSMAKEKKHRYQNAKEFLDDISQYKESKNKILSVKSEIKLAWQLLNEYKFDECKEALIELNHKFSKVALTYLALGEFYNKRKQHDKAIEILQEGVKNAGDDISLYKTLAITFIQTEQVSNAIAVIEKVASIGLSEKEKIHLLQMVKKISSKSKIIKKKKIIILCVINGPDKGQKFIFGEGIPIVIGRSVESNLFIKNDPLVSRKHAVIDHKKELMIQDMNSTNGTYVNNKRVSRAVVKDNDVIGVGETKIIINIRTIEGYLMPPKSGK